MSIPLIDRLQRRLKVMPDDCWEFQGCRYGGGYGWIRQNKPRKMVAVHRVMWEYVNNKMIPDGLEIMHTCDNPPCCNPSHLFKGTHADNMADMASKGRAATGVKHNGEANGRAKLTQEQVYTILFDSRFHRIIAKDYGVCRSTVSTIKRGESWNK